MSLKAYNDACLRAELFGQPKPDKDQFLEKNKHLDVVEVHEEDIITAETTAMLNEKLTGATGGLNELHSILGSTQTKLNRLKEVCGSLTNMLRFKLTSRDNLSYSSEPSYIGQGNFDTDYVPPKTPDLNAGRVDAHPASVYTGLGPSHSVAVHKGKSDLNTALADLETMQKSEDTPLVSKASARDVKEQVSSQISKLDALISKADTANCSMQHQNKQMRSFLR